MLLYEIRSRRQHCNRGKGEPEAPGNANAELKSLSAGLPSAPHERDRQKSSADLT
jgi:hypothetical protein